MRVSQLTVRSALNRVVMAGLLSGALLISPLGAQEPGATGESEGATAEAQQEQQEQAEDQQQAQERVDELRGEIERLQQELMLRSRDLQGAQRRLHLDRAAAQRARAIELLDAARLNQEIDGLMQAAPDGQLWIGVNTASLTDEKREELGLDASIQGVVVASVVEGSPAEEAGLQVDDVLMSIEGEELENIASLVKAVRESEGKPLTMQVMRAGDTTEVAVTPAARPAQFLIPNFQFEGFNAAPLNAARLPENFSVRISRQGEGPAEIVVEHNGETYEVTSDSIDMLPKEVQEPVRNALRGIAGNGNGAIQIQLGRAQGGAIPLPGALPEGFPFPAEIFEAMPGIAELDIADGMVPQFRAMPLFGAEAAVDRESLKEEMDQMREEMAEIKAMLRQLLEDRK